jgi:hypothetical protein
MSGSKRLRYLWKISGFHSRVEEHGLLWSYSLATCRYRHSRDTTLFRNFGNSFISRLSLTSHNARSLLLHFSYVQLSIVRTAIHRTYSYPSYVQLSIVHTAIQRTYSYPSYIQLSIVHTAVHRTYSYPSYVQLSIVRTAIHRTYSCPSS